MNIGKPGRIMVLEPLRPPPGVVVDPRGPGQNDRDQHSRPTARDGVEDVALAARDRG